MEPYAKSTHEQHSAMMRELVPSDRLLEWHVEDGWGPLCGFLGKDVPKDIPFPCANNKQGFQKRVEEDLDALGVKAVMNMAATLVVIIGMAYWFR